MKEHHKTIAAVGKIEIAIHCEFPEEIIQHIQSFMDEREATRTILVSKSWYGAWSRRPNLSFDQHMLRKRLQQFATKTMQRYDDHKLKIQTFRLHMYDDDSVARELILKAIELGAIDLTIEFSNSDLTIEFSISDTSRCFVVPDEVLESETLVRLSVSGCRVDLERMKKPLTSSNLKSLTLTNTVTIGDLSRRFPLLEELTVEGYFSSRLPFYGCTTKLHKLKFFQLDLGDLNTGDRFSKSGSWLQFPCLKTLVIWDRDFKLKGYGEENVIRICSPSLECVTINLNMFTKAKLEFDVPNIRKFKFNGYDVPRLEMKTSSREWESDILITCSVIDSVSWLHSLKQFVKLLSPSRVSLALHMIRPRCREDGFVGDGLAIPAVENLTIRGDRVAPAFLNAVFWSCHPNFVSIQRRCVRGIEKDNVEQFQHLSSLPWDTLLDYSISRDYWEEEFLRFQFR